MSAVAHLVETGEPVEAPVLVDVQCVVCDRVQTWQVSAQYGARVFGTTVGLSCECYGWPMVGLVTRLYGIGTVCCA